MAAANNQTNSNIQITKIRIYPIDRTEDALVQQHFAQFGKIMFIDYRKKRDFRYAFVQFENAESASRAIEKLQHQISPGKEIKAKAADPWHQPIPVCYLTDIPDPDSPFNIVNKLNDDCLLEIFKYFKLPALCSIAETCTRFQPVAKKAFSKRFTDLNERDLIDQNENEKLFRNFGNEIKSLSLTFLPREPDVTNQLLELMATFCSGTKSVLSKLNIFNWDIPGSFTERLKPIFKRLKSLKIRNAYYNAEIDPLVYACDDLIELTLWHVDFR